MEFTPRQAPGPPLRSSRGEARVKCERFACAARPSCRARRRPRGLAAAAAAPVPARGRPRTSPRPLALPLLLERARAAARCACLPGPGPCAVAGPQPRLRQLCTLTHRPAGAPSYCPPTAGANIPFAAPASSCRWIDRLRRWVVTKPACRRRLSPPIRPCPARRLRPRTIGTVPPPSPRTRVRRLLPRCLRSPSEQVL